MSKYEITDDAGNVIGSGDHTDAQRLADERREKVYYEENGAVVGVTPTITEAMKVAEAAYRAKQWAEQAARIKGTTSALKCRACGAHGHTDHRGLGISCGCAAE